MHENFEKTVYRIRTEYKCIHCKWFYSVRFPESLNKSFLDEILKEHLKEHN